MKTTLRRLLPILCAGLLLTSSGLAQKPQAPQEEQGIPPIELKEVTLEYAVRDLAGSELVWKAPTAEAPNTIPATTERLRFTAKVVNRPKGSAIMIKATLQEVCPSPDDGKNFLAKLRHLTESDPTNTTDPADNELQVIGQDGRVTIEIPTHCDDCIRSTCADSCDRDHLGEGPHSTTIRASDRPPPPRAKQRKGQVTAVAKPAYLRLDIITVCPEEELRRRAR